MAKKNNPIVDTPGMASIKMNSPSQTDVTKIGSRKRDDVVSKGKAPKAPAITKTPAPIVKAPPKKEVDPAKVAPKVKTARTTPKLNTKSSFTAKGSNYDIIDDNVNARRLIKWDDSGNVASDSPVTVIGKNSNGGFILAATENLSGVNKSSFPYSETEGINFPSLESDKAGSSPSMQGVHKNTYSDINEIYNPKAASQLRGIYKRTGQL